MAQAINRLSARAVATITKPGRHADGGNLFLVVDKAGSKRWVFLTRAGGKQREYGLGSVHTVSLAAARQLASEYRAMLAQGVDPRTHRVATAVTPTFSVFVDEWLAENESQWRNTKHRAQWRMTLEVYAAPLAPMALSDIRTDDVLDVLRPIWKDKPETASRLRGRIERVLDAAKAKGYRSGENPARWKGHLQSLLPPRQKLSRGHHAAMPFNAVPEFMAQLTARGSIAARALRFLILTAARSGEVLNATWDEFDLDTAVWSLSPSRMKAGRPHRVPLSTGALALLNELKAVSSCEYVFPGQRAGRPLANMALHMQLRRMKCSYTPHGFRSSFRDWCGECTDYPREIAEQALAHVVGDMTERAYRRGDALERRRLLMEDWAAYCEGHRHG